MSRIGATTRLADPELMSWDSEWWRMTVAKASHPHVDQWALENTVGLMWLLIPSDRPDEAQEAEAHGWRFMDVRVEFERPTSREALIWRIAQPDEKDRLVEIARESHRITRFYADPTLDDERCDDLYEAWLRSSMDGWAHTVIAGGRVPPDGYVTVHVDGDTSSIGLIAVDADARGHGLGQVLVEGALSAAYKAGAETMSVVTQGRNIAAQRLFQRCGFKTTRTDLWFHKRFDQ